MSATTPRIAILGAGACGLLVARALRRHGLTDLVLYDRHRIADSTRTHVADRHAFDFSTKFVPAVTLRGPGLPAELAEVLREDGGELRPSQNPFFWDPGRRRLVDPPFLAGFSKLRVLAEALRGWDLLLSAEDAGTVDDLLASGLVRPAETIHAWGARHGLQSVAAMFAYLADIFSAGRAVEANAAYLLKSRLPFAGALFQRMFRTRPAITRAVAATLRLRGKPLKHRDALDVLLDGSASPVANHVLVGGYRPFFERLATREGLDVRFSEVERVEPVGGRVRIALKSEESALFDHVLVTCPPWDAAPMFAPGSDRARLLALERPARRIESWMVRARGWPADVAGKEGVLLDAHNRAGLGTARLAFDGRPYGASKEYADSDLLVAPVYRGPELDDDLAEQRLREGLRALGLEPTEVVARETFVYPRVADLARVAGGWFSAIEALQGRDGIFFLGEVFAGQGIPSIARHAVRMAARVAASVRVDDAPRMVAT